MSDRARNYVKQLDLPWNLKGFLFLLADYHNVKDGYAWPGLETLAEVTGKDPRNVKRLIRQLESTGLFRFVPGIGRGNRSQFFFLDLEKGQGAKCHGAGKEVEKAVAKEVISEMVIRKNHEPLNKTSPNPSLQEGNSGYRLRRRDHSRISNWIEKEDRRNDVGQSRLDNRNWIDIVREASLFLMIPFDDVQHDLLRMDEEIWSVRLGLRKEPGRARA